jgi:hypothetical protein
MKGRSLRQLFSLGLVAATAAISATTAVCAEDAEVQNLSFNGVNCRIENPIGYTFSDSTLPVGKVFSFSHNEEDKSHASILNVFVVTHFDAKSNSVPELMKGVLEPYREKLATFKQSAISAETLNKRGFQRENFSGSFREGVKTRGFLYAAAHGTNCIVLMGEANNDANDLQLNKLRAAIKTFVAD